MVDKVYTVDVFYSDYEGSCSIQVGIFTDKSVAESIKEKWENFHTMYDHILNEPDNWDPTKDEWHKHHPENDMKWKESNEFYKLKAKYEKFDDFDEVRIEEFDLNVDGFYNQMKTISNDNFMTLIKEYERDWKLKEILK